LAVELSTDRQLVHRWRKGGEWKEEVVCGNGNIADEIEAVFDRMGRCHLLYELVNAGKDNRQEYAKWEGVWSEVSSYLASMSISKAGKVHVIFTSRTPSILRHGEWQITR
jgi:hypothetical protein